MDRATYNACIGDKMRGQKLTMEQRKAAFCEASKLCSGKASSEEEAKKICSIPKPLKVRPVSTMEVTGEPTMRRKKTPRNFMIICKNEGIERAECLLNNLQASGMTITDDFRKMVINAEVSCQCQK
jgi:hypothetical protein